MEKLTAKQKAVYAFIEWFIRMHRISPSVRDICEAFGFASPNGAECHLVPLERKGVIVRQPGCNRGIALVGKTCKACRGLGVICK